MIVVIPRTGSQSNCGSQACGEQEWIPRTCPRCAQPAIIGHGRRWKSAHDQNHTRICVRRGLCNACELTITILPIWSLPYSRYSLYARADSLRRFADPGVPLEQALPQIRDPDRVTDPATLRRWCQRRLASLWACTAAVRALGHTVAAMLSPTIFAWDWPAAARMLAPEAQPA